jgi:type II secretory pathway component PulF
VPVYSYRARDGAGALVTGTLQGDSPDKVARELQGQGYTPVSVRPHAGKSKLSLDVFSRVSEEDLIVFSRQMATMIKAGIPFIRCLDTLEAQTSSKRLKGIIRDVKVDVERGAAFSDALGKFSREFSPLYVGMVRVGEEAGVLDEMLDRLAALLEHEAVTKQRVKTAVRYPLIVVASLTAAFFFLTTFVIPKFASVYASSSVALPLPTRVLLWLSGAVTDYWWLIIAGAAGAVAALKLYVGTTGGRWQLDRLKLRAPLVGNIVRKAVMARFARIFATLYRSGIPVLHSLDVVTGTLGNVLVARAVDVIKEDVREGSPLVTPMQKTGMFPPIVVQMVGVGEETGALDEMLNKVADYFDSEVEYSIRNLSTTLEPVLLAVLAGAVLFLALGVFLPMWDLISAFRR